MLKLTSAFALATLLCASAFADGMEYAPRRSYQRFYLPAERHVIEVVQPPYSGNFIINGARFTARTLPTQHMRDVVRRRLVVSKQVSKPRVQFGDCLIEPPRQPATLVRLALSFRAPADRRDGAP